MTGGWSAAILRRPRLAIGVAVLTSACVGLAARYVLEPPSQVTVFGDAPPPSAVPAVLSAVFSEAGCHSPSEAADAVRRGLSAAGLASWSVRIAHEVKPSDCVTSTYNVANQEVVLKLAMRPEVANAVHTVADALLKDCFDRDHAEAILREALMAVQPGEFELRTDGNEAGPTEREAEIHEHFMAGCWIYSGSGWEADGTPIYWIGGL